MPGMSGWEVARQIKRLSPETKVVLTSGWGVELEHKPQDEGLVDAVLPKPVSLRSLLDCVESMLGTSDGHSTDDQGESSAEIPESA